jgi:hypothetical protein
MSSPSCQDQNQREQRDKDRSAHHGSFPTFSSYVPCLSGLSLRFSRSFHTLWCNSAKEKKMRQKPRTFGLQIVLVSATFRRDFPDASRLSAQSIETSESSKHPMRFLANANAPALPT